MVLETTNVAKFKNRTPKALRLLAFLEAKKGHGQELMNILLTLVKPTLEEDGNIAMYLIFHLTILTRYYLMNCGVTKKQ